MIQEENLKKWRDIAMPTLEWIGKDKVVNHHMEVPFRVLELQVQL